MNREILEDASISFILTASGMLKNSQISLARAKDDG